jgi:2-(1,2-epoxy-1,2-dihydrophenyl)acetyl-CoA isomerase
MSNHVEAFDLVRTERRELVTILTMLRSERRNALSVALRESLIASLSAAMQDVDCRAIVLTGAGAHFCAGGDLDDFALEGIEMARRRVQEGHVLPRTIAGGDKPVVAAVEGCAYGAGLSLAAICDHVVVAEDARICASFAKVGLMPDYGLLWSLPRRIGQTKATEMLMQATELTGREAVACGFANECCASGGTLERAVAVAAGLTTRAPLTLAAVKRAQMAGLEAIFEQELELQPTLFLSADFAEAIAAFRHKRPPQFRSA